MALDINSSCGRTHNDQQKVISQLNKLVMRQQLLLYNNSNTLARKLLCTSAICGGILIIYIIYIMQILFCSCKSNENPLKLKMVPTSIFSLFGKHFKIPNEFSPYLGWIDLRFLSKWFWPNKPKSLFYLQNFL